MTISDRELDALVAEKVMNDTPGQVWPRAYSTDIAAAWSIIDHFNALPRGAGGAKRRPAKRFARELQVAGILRHDGPVASRAICLAALRALGVEVPA